MESQGKKNITVYYDGACRMCSGLIGTIERSSKGSQFSVRDIARGELPHGATIDDVNKEIYVVEKDGSVHKNAEAILKILEQYPGWRKVVWMGRLPLIRELLRAGYFFISSHRYRFFGKTRGRE